MKKTERYQLNIIEKEDDFSPEPLNENMEKVETQLDAARAEAAAGDAALDQRVQVLELHKCVSGSYVGDGTKNNDAQFINLGFTPVAVITSYGLTTPEHIIGVRIVPGGFEGFNWISNTYVSGSNIKGTTYYYLALC